MGYTIRRVRAGDEATLAFIQTESWNAGFRDILPGDVLRSCTRMEKSTAMYRRLLESGVGNGYLLKVDGQPHCIAWWDAARGTDMPGYAELICIHSMPNRWRKGYGSKMMQQVLQDMRSAGYKKAMLWVFEANTRARQFYEAQGFRPNGKTKPGIEPTELCYERDL